MNKTNFLPFTIVQYDQAYRLWESCEGVGLSEADSRRNIELFLDRNPGLSFLAISDNEVVGTILAGHDGRRGYIHHLAVSKSVRRQGIGKNLVRAALARFQEIGILKCHLFIFNSNISGVNFWNSVGWTYRDDLNMMSKTISYT